MDTVESLHAQALLLVEQNDVKQVRALLLNASKLGLLQRLLQMQDESGRTLLMAAAAADRMEITMLLLGLGADVNQFSMSSSGVLSTALHEATAGRRQTIARALVSYKANPFLADALGATPMDQAISSGQAALVREYQCKALHVLMVAFKVHSAQGSGAVPWEWRSCHAVLSQQVPFPDGSGEAVPRLNLLIFDSVLKTAELRTRLWLDGASSGTNAAGESYLVGIRGLLPDRAIAQLH